MNLIRVLKHRFTTSAAVRRRFPDHALARIAEAIAASERLHRGEIRFAVEGGLPWSYLWKNLSARSRAMMVFSKLRVWDTAENNGVLIYVVLADRHVEIIADRGMTACISPQQWDEACALILEGFRSDACADGVIAGIGAVSALLTEHFPAVDGVFNTNELPNTPAVM